MDSRGVYMARDTAVEKYSPLIIQNLRKIAGLMKEWTSLIRPEDKDTMDRANARVAEFVRFRTELVRLSREAKLPSRAAGATMTPIATTALRSTRRSPPSPPRTSHHASPGR